MRGAFPLCLLVSVALHALSIVDLALLKTRRDVPRPQTVEVLVLEQAATPLPPPLNRANGVTPEAPVPDVASPAYQAPRPDQEVPQAKALDGAALPQPAQPISEPEVSLAETAHATPAADSSKQGRALQQSEEVIEAPPQAVHLEVRVTHYESPGIAEAIRALEPREDFPIRIVPEPSADRQSIVGIRIFGIWKHEPLGVLGFLNGDRLQLFEPEDILDFFEELRAGLLAGKPVEVITYSRGQTFVQRYASMKDSESATKAGPVQDQSLDVVQDSD